MTDTIDGGIGATAQVDRLARYLLEKWPTKITGGGAGDVAIRILQQCAERDKRIGTLESAIESVLHTPSRRRFHYEDSNEDFWYDTPWLSKGECQMAMRKLRNALGLPCAEDKDDVVRHETAEMIDWFIKAEEVQP